MGKKKPPQPDWTAYAADACQSLIDASMFWDAELEGKVPLLKRARTMAGLAMQKYRENLGTGDAHPPENEVRRIIVMAMEAVSVGGGTYPNRLRDIPTHHAIEIARDRILRGKTEADVAKENREALERAVRAREEEHPFTVQKEADKEGLTLEQYKKAACPTCCRLGCREHNHQWRAGAHLSAVAKKIDRVREGM